MVLYFYFFLIVQITTDGYSSGAEAADAKSKKDKDTERKQVVTDVTLYFSAQLDKLLTVYSSESSVLTPLVAIPRVMDASVLAAQSAGVDAIVDVLGRAVLTQSNQAVLTQSNQAVLAAVGETIGQFAAAETLKDETTQRLQTVYDTLVTALKNSIADVEAAANDMGDYEETLSDALTAMEVTLRRLRTLIEHVDTSNGVTKRTVDLLKLVDEVMGAMDQQNSSSIIISVSFFLFFVFCFLLLYLLTFCAHKITSEALFIARIGYMRLASVLLDDGGKVRQDLARSCTQRRDQIFGRCQEMMTNLNDLNLSVQVFSVIVAVGRD